MTPFDRFDGRFADALDDLASPRIPDYFEDVLAVALRRSQRPAWTFLERWIPVSTLTRRSVLVPGVPWRTVGILLALLALLVAGAVISIGLRPDRTPAPPFGPAANGLIAYVSGGDIYSRDFTTGSETLLVGGPEEDVYPIFSRDGLSLAWFRLGTDDPEGGTLMVANADGTAVRSLLGPVMMDWAAWSPTSDEIALIASVDGVRTLSIVPIEGGEQARVIDLDIEPGPYVEWRPPNGDELIFGGVGGIHYAVYGVRPDGTGLRQISALSAIDEFWGPYHITPDGSRMLYTRGGDHIQVGILDLETGDQRLFGAALPPPPDFNGVRQHHGMEAILPDGKTILFGRYWNELDGEINHQLYVATIDSDGADAVAVGELHRSQSGRNPFWPAVSPDGESILIVDNDTFATWIAHPDGAAPERVGWPAFDDVPSWQRIAP